MTDRSIARFQYSTEDAFSYVLSFTGLVLTDRDFEVKIKDRVSGTTRATLTIGDGLTIVSASEISAAYPKEDMANWPLGEYSADLVDVTGEPSTVMAVRFVYDKPGNLVYGVKDRKAFINWAPNQAVVTATGAVGPAGPRGPQGEQGDPGTNGTNGTDGVDGADGSDGWTPSFAVVADAGRRVLQVADWVGGDGTKPATGLYVGATGLVSSIGDAVNIRGDQGPAGSVVDGDKGDITVSDGGTAWTVDPRAIAFAKIVAVATSRLLGRKTSGSGDIEVLTPSDARGILQITAQGETLILASDAATQRSALGANANGSDIFTGATALGKSLATAGDAAAARSALGVPFELIRAVAVSGSPATIDFTGSDFPAGFDTFIVVFDGIAPAVDDAYLALRVQTGGSTWQTSGYGYAGRVQGPGGGADTGTTIDGISGLLPLTRPAVGSGVGNAAGEGVNGTLFMNPADANARRRAYGHCAFTRSDGVDSEYHFGGGYGSANAATGLRLLWSSGAFANKGNLKLYGQRS